MSKVLIFLPVMLSKWFFNQWFLGVSLYGPNHWSMHNTIVLPFCLLLPSSPSDMVKLTKAKTFQAYLDSCHRRYSCVHCRAHLANHDDLISKVCMPLFDVNNNFSWNTSWLSHIHTIGCIGEKLDWHTGTENWTGILCKACVMLYLIHM